MTITLILALLDFEQSFVVECDALDAGIGAILLQHNKQVAYFSQAIPDRHYHIPAYEKELIGLVKAIKHWRSYVWGQKFLVRTNYCSLKFFWSKRYYLLSNNIGSVN